MRDSVHTIDTIEAECLEEKRSLSPVTRLHSRISPSPEPLTTPITPGCKDRNVNFFRTLSDT